MSFASLGLLTLATQPAQAQYSGGGWSPVPCDASGAPLSNAYPDSNGFYTMNGTEADDVQNGYPPDLVGYEIANNDYRYSTAFSPLTSTPNGPIPGTILYQGISGSAIANNNLQNGSGYYSSGFSYDIYSNGVDSRGLLNGTIHSTLTGQLVYYFKEVWQGYGTPTPVPDHLDILLKTTVSASAGVDYGLSGLSSGLSATATASDDQFQENVTATGGFINTPAPVVGYHLVRASVDPGTQVAEVYLNGTVDATAVNTVPYGTLDPQSSMNNKVTNGAATTGASGGVVSVVKPDSREVEITSPDIETSYQFGPLDPNTNTYPQNKRTLDGSIVTDSAVSPPLTQPGGGSSWTSSPGMLGQAGGFINPIFAWSMAGGQGSLSASGNTSHTQLSVQFPLSSTDKALNKQSTVRLDVTDSDGATAANTFTVRWHYPKENAKLIASGTPFWQEAELKTNPASSVAYVNGSAIGTYGYSTYTDFYPVAAADIFTVVANGTPSPSSFTTPAWSAFVAAVGIAASQIQPITTAPTGSNFNDCWGDPLSTGWPSPPDPALMNQYQMEPMLKVQFQEQTWQYEQYDQHGYTGPANEGINHFTGKAESAGNFSLIGTTPPAGSG